MNAIHIVLHTFQIVNISPTTHEYALKLKMVRFYDRIQIDRYGVFQSNRVKHARLSSGAIDVFAPVEGRPTQRW